MSGLFIRCEAVGVRPTELVIVEADDRDIFGDAEAESSSDLGQISWPRYELVYSFEDETVTPRGNPLTVVI